MIGPKCLTCNDGYLGGEVDRYWTCPACGRVLPPVIAKKRDADLWLVIGVTMLVTGIACVAYGLFIHLTGGAS